MKLDKIKFARLIGFIASITGKDFTSDDVDYIDRMIDVEMPVSTGKVSEDDVNILLKEIIDPNGFINAIKAYRILTGAGLKESKEAIEKYRLIPNFQKGNQEPATLGDILRKATP